MAMRGYFPLLAEIRRCNLVIKVRVGTKMKIYGKSRFHRLPSPETAHHNLDQRDQTGMEREDDSGFCAVTNPFRLYLAFGSRVR